MGGLYKQSEHKDISQSIMSLGERIQLELDKDNASLAFLDLNNHIDDLIKGLSSSLCKSTFIDLSHNSLNPYSFKAILESLENSYVKAIDFTSNNIGKNI